MSNDTPTPAPGGLLPLDALVREYLVNPSSDGNALRQKLRAQMAEATRPTPPAQPGGLLLGDYVLATKYTDGDPGDHWAVGFYRGVVADRHIVVDVEGGTFRANGFRRCEKITEAEGAHLLRLAPAGAAGSVWGLIDRAASPAPGGLLPLDPVRLEKAAKAAQLAYDSALDDWPNCIQGAEATIRAWEATRSAEITDDVPANCNWVHDADLPYIAKYLIYCAESWEGNARLIGNARASDIAACLRGLLATPPAQPAGVSEALRDASIDELRTFVGRANQHANASGGLISSACRAVNALLQDRLAAAIADTKETT